MSTVEQLGRVIPAHINSYYSVIFKKISPEGTFENSPAVYCRDSVNGDQVPKGRLKNGPCIRPSLRDSRAGPWVPGVKTPGYSQWFLRNQNRNI